MVEMVDVCLTVAFCVCTNAILTLMSDCPNRHEFGFFLSFLCESNLLYLFIAHNILQSVGSFVYFTGRFGQSNQSHSNMAQHDSSVLPSHLCICLLRPLYYHQNSIYMRQQQPNKLPQSKQTRTFLKIFSC